MTARAASRLSARTWSRSGPCGPCSPRSPCGPAGPRRPRFALATRGRRAPFFSHSTVPRADANAWHLKPQGVTLWKHARDNTQPCAPPPCAITVSLLAVAGRPNLDAVQQSFDVLIRDGRVVDGTGAPARTADIGITGGRIAAVGALRRRDRKQTIDAAGHVVAPGFIDVHTHADEIAQHPLAEHFVRMGVTTVVAGNCGGSADDVARGVRDDREDGHRRSTTRRWSATTRCDAP